MTTRPKIRLMTNSRGKTARRCGLLHELRYELGYESTAKTAEPLAHGDAGHRALEAWWLFWQSGEEGSALRAALLELDAAVVHHEVDHFHAARLQAMIEGYHKKWAPEMEAGEWEVIGVELEFVAPLLGPDGKNTPGWVQGGKLDVLLRHNATGRVTLLEHKTSSEDVSPGTTYWKRLRMDGQPSTYLDGARANGYEVDDLLFDVLRKPDQKPYRATPPEERQYTKEKSKKCPDCKGPPVVCAACGSTGRIVTEASRLIARQREEDEATDAYLNRCREAIAAAPDAFYLREPVPRMPRELARHRDEVYDLAVQLDGRRARDFSPRNTDGCFHFNRECEFWPVCTGAASLSDERLYRIRATVHPELSFPERPETPSMATRERLGIHDPGEETPV